MFRAARPQLNYKPRETASCVLLHLFKMLSSILQGYMCMQSTMQKSYKELLEKLQSQNKSKLTILLVGELDATLSVATQSPVGSVILAKP